MQGQIQRTGGPGGYTIINLGGATSINYRRSRNIAMRAYKRAPAEDKKVISGMISDCEFVEEWLVTGRRPGNKRGIERRAAYQRERPVDPLKMQAYMQRGVAGSPSNLTDWQRWQIEDALSRLSPRERECYMMSRGECFSYAEIASMLMITRSTAQYYVEQAQKKISEDVGNSLFLV